MCNKASIKLLGDSDEWDEEQISLVSELYQFCLQISPLPKMNPDSDNTVEADMLDHWRALQPLVKLCLFKSDSVIKFDEYSVFVESFSLQKLSIIFDLFVENNDYNAAGQLLVAFSEHGIHEQKTFTLIDVCLNSSIDKYFNYRFVVWNILSLHLVCENEYTFDEQRLLNSVKEFADKCFKENYWEILISIIVTSADYLPSDFCKNLRARFLTVYKENKRAMIVLAESEKRIDEPGEEEYQKFLQFAESALKARFLINKLSGK